MKIAMLLIKLAIQKKTIENLFYIRTYFVSATEHRQCFILQEVFTIWINS